MPAAAQAGRDAFLRREVQDYAASIGLAPAAASSDGFHDADFAPSVAKQPLGASQTAASKPKKPKNKFKPEGTTPAAGSASQHAPEGNKQADSRDWNEGAGQRPGAFE